MTAKKKPAIHPGKIERNKWTYALNVLNKNAITIPTMNSFFNEDDSNMPSTSEGKNDVIYLITLMEVSKILFR